MSGSAFRDEVKRAAATIAGTFLYALGINMFIVPASLYTGGLMGICQVIRTLLAQHTTILPTSFDIAGILYYILNIPIVIVALFVLDKRFLLRTLFSVTLTTIFLSLIPTHSLLGGDIITSCLVGGVISGIGTGITLWAGCCGGGMDIISMMIVSKNKHASVGRVNLFVNVLLYLGCLLLFDVRTAIYSIVYSAIYSTAMDKMHFQNIDEEVMIITKHPTEEMKTEIMQKMIRGLTRIDAEGEFTGEPESIFYIVISKYETQKLLSIIRKHDPSAFVTVKEHTNVYGNYIKKI